MKAPDIPEITLHNLQAYVDHGLLGGHFLTAMITNDIQAAVAHADLENQRALVAIAKWLYNQAPMGCHGSRDKMLAWAKHKGLEGVLQ